MRKLILSFFLAGSVFAGELLKEGELLTGLEMGQRSEPLPVLIRLKGSGCAVYAVAVPGDAKRVWVRPEKLYCGGREERVRGFVTDEAGILGVRCDSVPCLLEKGTRVKVFLERKTGVEKALESVAEKLVREWNGLVER